MMPEKVITSCNVVDGQIAIDHLAVYEGCRVRVTIELESVSAKRAIAMSEELDQAELRLLKQEKSC